MRKNIIWITLDSVRADHTTMGGYTRDTTPNLQRIADHPKGQYYSMCIATGNGTPTSSASILTGTYPSHHGFKMTNSYVPDQLDTVPELLGEQGYFTTGLSRNSYLSSGSGLDRGFDRFEWFGSSNFFNTVDIRTIIKFLFNIRKHSAGLTIDTAKHSTPYVMNAILKRWLRELQDDEPLFIYAHYNEPHRPYYPPHSHLDRYTDHLEISGKQAAELALDIHYRVPQIIADNELSEQEKNALIAMYDTEIAYTDECIGVLFDYIQSLDMRDTIFIVTADHGEYLGEHGLLGHTLGLNDEVIHVPLLTYGIDGIDHQSGELVQHIDLMQTLVARAGGRTEQFQGINLEDETREFAISQRGETDFEKYLEYNPQFNTSPFHQSMLTALRTTEYKYQKSSDKKKLFKLPNERKDVSDEYLAVTRKLDEQLDDWLNSDGQPINEQKENEFSAAMKKQLRELGYLE